MASEQGKKEVNTLAEGSRGTGDGLLNKNDCCVRAVAKMLNTVKAAALRLRSGQGGPPHSRLGVPGDARELPFAILPLCAGEEARGDFDQARSELEDCDRGPRLAVAGAKGAFVKTVGHAFIRDG